PIAPPATRPSLGEGSRPSPPTPPPSLREGSTGQVAFRFSGWRSTPTAALLPRLLPGAAPRAIISMAPKLAGLRWLDVAPRARGEFTQGTRRSRVAPRTGLQGGGCRQKRGSV